MASFKELKYQFSDDFIRNDYSVKKNSLKNKLINIF